MALKACRECGQQVSTRAETCPHCGVRSPVRGNAVTAAIRGLLRLVFFMGILLIMAVWLFGGSKSPPNASKQSTAVEQQQAVEPQQAEQQQKCENETPAERNRGDNDN